MPVTRTGQKRSALKTGLKRRDNDSCLLRFGVCNSTRWNMLKGFKVVGSEKKRKRKLFLKTTLAKSGRGIKERSPERQDPTTQTKRKS
eukprot:scaffold244726_cov20-Tisochrysis_lutea.AAC.1